MFLSIRTKVFVSMLGVVPLASLLLILSMLYLSEAEIRKSKLGQLAHISEIKAHEIEHYFDQMAQVLLQIRALQKNLWV